MKGRTIEGIEYDMSHTDDTSLLSNVTQKSMDDIRRELYFPV